MKLKRYHIMLFATICFLIVFIGINRKYDRFYRIQGMNNDNRMLIETYLDSAQQEYIIQNNIPVDQFIDYIQIDGFLIYNYEYYHQVENQGTFNSLVEVVTHTNAIIEKLNEETPWSVNENLTTLIDNNLLLDYETNNSFNFNYINLYTDLKPYYVLEEENYIEAIDTLVQSLSKLGMTSISDSTSLLNELFIHYSPIQVSNLMNYALEAKKMNFVIDPTDIVTLVDQDHFITDYVPENLVVIEDIPRLSYFTYLNEEVYSSLKEMFEAYKQVENTESIMVVEGYQSYETLEKSQAGFSESQLGLQVSFKVEGIAISEFDTTNFKEWLNDNAYLYGFILRYPQDKNEITNHDYESNVYRYVGKDVALKMKNENISTLEEYHQNDSQGDL